MYLRGQSIGLQRADNQLSKCILIMIDQLLGSKINPLKVEWSSKAEGQFQWKLDLGWIKRGCVFTTREVVEVRCG